MSDPVKREIEKAFSILPDEAIPEAVRNTLTRLRADQGVGNPLLKWADFTPSGRFLRGGITTMSDYINRTITNPEDDSEIAAMVADVADGGAEAGRVIRDIEGESFYWFLPIVTSSDVSAFEPRLRGFRVDQGVFDAIVSYFNSGRGLTLSERRVAFQLVSGSSLREAADVDGVGVETKRAQSKSAAAKMQCGGQIDLVRTLLGQLVQVLAISQGGADHARIAEHFIASHIGSQAELTVLQRSDHEFLRLIEIGPRDGVPLVFCHGMMFGMLLLGSADLLERHNLRLMMPVRRGYLENRPVLGLRAESNLIDASLEDLDFVMSTLPRGNRNVLGQSLGGGLAVEFARRHPGKVDRLVLASTNLARANAAESGFADELYKAYRNLIRTGGLSRAITLEFSAHYPDETKSRTILYRMFGDCHADCEAMEGLGLAPPVHGWFADLYRSSVAGVAEDYAFTMRALKLPRLKIPVMVAHGGEDPLTRPDDIRKAISHWENSRFHLFPEAGHFLTASHGEQFWDTVAGFVVQSE
jgi:pimeloyl-ACP methyl ester carboxylesterase